MAVGRATAVESIDLARPDPIAAAELALALDAATRHVLAMTGGGEARA